LGKGDVAALKRTLYKKRQNPDKDLPFGYHVADEHGKALKIRIQALLNEPKNNPRFSTIQSLKPATHSANFVLVTKKLNNTGPPNIQKIPH
jgi:hypothetical protein